jgi:hypothetical protein
MELRWAQATPNELQESGAYDHFGVKSAERNLGKAIAHVRYTSESARIGAPPQSAASGQ